MFSSTDAQSCYRHTVPHQFSSGLPHAHLGSGAGPSNPSNRSAPAAQCRRSGRRLQAPVLTPTSPPKSKDGTPEAGNARRPGEPRPDGPGILMGVEPRPVGFLLAAEYGTPTTGVDMSEPVGGRYLSITHVVKILVI